MRIIIHPRSEGGVNVVEMRDSQSSADAKYSSTMETPNVITLEMEEGAERILLVGQNGDRSKWVIEENEIGDQWLRRTSRPEDVQNDADSLTLGEYVAQHPILSHDHPIPYRVKGGRTEV